ncbi:helix-turn-helix transcriptional regulator [Pseudorhodoferax sp.]|uniref:helix-turn-helix transcriptional regulator n=1 Tax=Pseudorhodoferax sp. TaxID=1993553 RepID=UPI002DD68AAB|nr:helix-turn-helix transcriptional regulator [Pseudorhodoferax sp.]
MLDSLTSALADTAWGGGDTVAVAPRRFQPDATAMLRCIIEHVDYGLALISIASRRLRLANSPALLAMSGDSGHSSGLAIVAGEICALTPQGERALERSLTLARTGVRDLLNVNKTGTRTTVAVVPLAGPEDDGHALLIFAKPRLCDATTLALFARSCDLTAAESNVLAAVCEGKRPHEVASQHGVQVSTVRSQLLSIRQKTRSGSIRELVQTVSLLPPMARHLA